MKNVYLSLCVFSSLHDQKSSRQNASHHGVEHTSFCESVLQGQLSRSLFLSRFFFFFTRAKALSSFIPIYVITVFGQMCFRLAYSDCISGIHSVPKHFLHFSDSLWRGTRFVSRVRSASRAVVSMKGQRVILFVDRLVSLGYQCSPWFWAR